MVRLPPLQTLRALEAAVRHRSYSKAAQELNLTHGAISHQMRRLEQDLGASLFNRSGNAMLPTAAAVSLAAAVARAVEDLCAAVSDVAGAGEEVLAITTLQSLASQWLVPRLGAFQKAHPGIAVRLETEGRVVDLLRENFDVALRSGSGDWPGLESIYLAPTAVTPVCAPAFAEQFGLGRPEDLLAAPRIGAHENWAAWFAAAGVAAPEAPARPRLTADLHTIEVASALAGNVAALGSPVLFAAEISQGRLVQPFQVMLHSSAGFWLTYPRERRRAAKIVAFREWLLAAIAQDPATAAHTEKAA
jgi:LysR family glycine cleavage system transcriptional activator